MSGGVTAHFCASDVSLYIADHLLARLDQQPYPEHVAHRPAHTEQAGLLAEKLRHPLLELVHCRVLGVHVIAYWRGQHGLPHLLSWLGDSVRAQIDHDKSLTTCAMCSLAGCTSLACARRQAQGACSARPARADLESQRHVGLDGIGSLDAASGQALRDKEGEFE
jgi:hypothetical protein